MNFVAPSAPPASPVDGQCYYYYNTVDEAVFVWQGSKWVQFTAAGTGHDFSLPVDPESVCPRCEDEPKFPGDYLCEGCRYGGA